MALTFVDDARSVIRNKRMVIATVTFDNSYPTGGESFTANDLGLASLDFVSATTDGSYAVTWDKTNSKLKAFVAAGTEVPNATNISTVAVRILAIGS
jgi:hypothetical protein